MTLLGRCCSLLEELHGDLLFEKISAFEINLVIVKTCGKCFGMEFHTADHALCHGNAFRIEDEFFRAVTGEKIQHA